MLFKSLAPLCLILLAAACKKNSDDKPGAAPVATVPGTQSGENAEGKPGDSVSSSNPSQYPSNDTVLKDTCRIAVDCANPLPELAAAAGWENTKNKLLDKATNPVHRGRDAVVKIGAPIPLIAKFSYTLADVDVKDEPVDIYLSQGCGKGWKLLGTEKTSTEDNGRTMDGIEDTGGYIMTEASKLGVNELPVGRHQFLFVLKATNESTTLMVEVLPAKAAIVLTDIDGTLTAFEEAAASDLLGIPPQSHEGAADMIRSFYHRGYSIFYLTARPAFFMQKTREWLNARGFPPGVIHTSPFKAGAIGEAAAQFKAGELAQLKANTGLVPAYAFGNKDSDVKAFLEAGIEASNSYFYKLKTENQGAHEDYRKLIPMAQAAPSFCI